MDEKRNAYKILEEKKTLRKETIWKNYEYEEG
jgi:hypothetical protein